jgi:hypothetical protein
MKVRITKRYDNYSDDKAVKKLVFYPSLYEQLHEGYT